jgi:16S rRNA (cytosine1402-N4)-methyltransferase
MTIHKTVLLEETIEALSLKEGMTVVDATLGGGGHALKVLEKIGKKGTLIAFDRDNDAIVRFKKSAEMILAGESAEKHIILLHDNYSALKDRIISSGISKVDAIVADLGISSDQLADSERGISFQTDSPLDMRMDQTKGITASVVVNTYAEQELARILEEFGGEKFAKKIAREIIAYRTKGEIKTTQELVGIIASAIPEKFKHGKIHFATKTFQALRMEVNEELKSLESFLLQAIELLPPEGRIAIITFHSGEDALVKKVLRQNARGCICPPEFPVCRCGAKPLLKLITRRPIIANEEEVSRNPRSRSAKLRVAEKI